MGGAGMRRKKGIIVLITMMLAFASGCGSSGSGSGGGGGNSVFVKEGSGQGESVPVNGNGEPSVGWGKSDESGNAGTSTEERFPGRANAETGEGISKKLSIGDVAPDFLVELSGGGTFRMSEHDDEIVLINFWATWCGPCVGEMPAFERLKDLGYSDVSILAINAGEGKSVVDSFVRSEGYTFPIGYDEFRKVGYYYPSDGIPYTIVVDHGIVQRIFLGSKGADAQYELYKDAIEECRK